jgi:murein DD-endopeptidase MepM/ murein hydrolase activator NlpD
MIPASTFTALPTQTQTPVPTLRPSPTATPVIHICSPLADHSLEELPQIVTEPFKAPRPGYDDGHHGLDLGYWSWNGKPIIGMPVQAVLAGKVAAVINDRQPYGNMLMTETTFERIPPALRQQVSIPSGQSLYLVYAHLQEPPAFEIGQSVTCGQDLGAVGLTGRTSGPHLHFETRWGPPDTTFQSMAFYTTSAIPEEMAAYQTWRLSGTYHLFDPMQLLELPQP